MTQRRRDMSFALFDRDRIMARCRMAYGRLIRTKKHADDTKGVAYIVAGAEAAEAIAIIRTREAGSDDEIEDLGRVSEQLLETLDIPSGEFLRIDAMAPFRSEHA
jgi:hypothetical protein